MRAHDRHTKFQEKIERWRIFVAGNEINRCTSVNANMNEWNGKSTVCIS